MTKKSKKQRNGEKNGGFVSAVKGSWKILLSIGIALGLVSSFFSFDARYQKTAQAQQEKQDILRSFEQLNKNLQIQQQQSEEKWKRINQESELKFLIAEEKRLYDKERLLKKDLAKNPNDKSVKEELEEVQKEREDVRRQITELKIKLR